MELPKNIIWIGNPDKGHKIYVEDYVISYIKQINRELYGNRAGLALYGRRYEEHKEKYYFLYGAAHILGLEGRGQYLSELEKETIEENRMKYFQGYDFLGWCALEGDLPDGFYLYEMGKGLFINGYACFYEKNESMLNFMLSTRKMQNEEKIEPKLKTDIPRPISESRAKKEIPAVMKKKETTEWMKTAVAGTAIILCIMGITTLNDSGKLEEIKVVARKVVEHMGEQQLPDKEHEADSALANPQADALQQGASTDSLTQPEQIQTVPVPEQVVGQQDVPSPLNGADTTVTVIEQPPSPVQEEQQMQQLMEQENQQSKDPVQEVPVTEPENMSYVVAKGDTLLSICKSQYGTTNRVKEICALNSITNADDIKIGQIILLPK